MRKLDVTTNALKQNLFHVQKQKFQNNFIKTDINKVDYALNERTMDIYEYDSYIKAKELGTQLIFVGKLVKKDGKYAILK
jgi:hypothetical protein